VFIGHCLGGLVIKQVDIYPVITFCDAHSVMLMIIKALADARPPDSSADNQAIFNACVGLFFFGVPNKGLNNENLMSMVKGQRNENLVNDLRVGSPLLQLAYENFLRGFKYNDCWIVSFYETHDTQSAEYNVQCIRSFL
jgi:hypothetical protein